MKQYRSVFTIGYGDGIGVGKKIGNLLADGRGVFLVVVVPPVAVEVRRAPRLYPTDCLSCSLVLPWMTAMDHSYYGINTPSFSSRT